MAPTSKRIAVLNDLVTRLGFVQVAKGYNTDAGLNILLGEFPRFGQGDPPWALAVMIGDESVEARGDIAVSTTPYEVWALVPQGTEQPAVAVELVVADIIEAVEGVEANPSRTRALGATVDGQAYGTMPKGVNRGPIRPAERPEGATYVGAVVTYNCSFESVWGAQ